MINGSDWDGDSKVDFDIFAVFTFALREEILSLDFRMSYYSDEELREVHKNVSYNDLHSCAISLTVTSFSDALEQIANLHIKTLPHNKNYKFTKNEILQLELVKEMV